MTPGLILLFCAVLAWFALSVRLMLSRHPHDKRAGKPLTETTMKLEQQFNRLCGSRHGWLMILVVGVGVLGFAVLLVDAAKYILLP